MGSSGYTLKKLLRQYSNDMGFSVRLLSIAQTLGIILAGVGFIGALAVLIHKLIHPETAVGWSSMVCLICFFSGIVLIALGILGNYIGRLYMGQTNEPQFVVRELRNVPCDERETADTGI